MAGRLTEAVRRGDTVARVGPSELAVMTDVEHGQDSECLAQRLVDLFRGPLLDDGRPLATKASVGVAMSSSTDDADQLLLMAEVAAAVAREAGGECHRTFAPDRDSI